ncbi:MAG: protein translocase subunit SecF [Candidatus Pacebacteria bacterium]|nr:protein translocase subunit SecF [Candidatus Paceibacterota bacterium]
MNLMKYRKIYLVFSGLLIILSIVFVLVFGLKLSIDFTGGSILELSYKKDRPSNPQILTELSGLDLGSVSVQSIGDKGVILKMKDINEEAVQQIISKLSLSGSEIVKERFETIGPSIGKELKDKTYLVVILSLFAIVIYIALAFRRIQRPLSSWYYGIGSLFNLLFDILIPLSVFSILGRIYNIEISIPIVAAFLTILGYSINNTVVVFDRIRENLLKRGGFFEDVINTSIAQTLSRQVNTGLTTLFGSMAIFLFGGQTLKYFSLALSLGILAGIYSSIFLANSILISWFKFREKR